MLDLCCGTGDQATALRRRGARVAAADFCVPMLAIARHKFAKTDAPRPAALAADALALPFPDRHFAGATVSFGLRNVADLDAALRQLARVLRRAGKLVVLEVAMPRLQPLKGLYLFYFRRLLPWIGRLLSAARLGLRLPDRSRCSASRSARSSSTAWPRPGSPTSPGRTSPAAPSASIREDPRDDRILDGKAVAAEIRAEVAAGVRALAEAGARPPQLAAVLVGDDPASQVYVGSKVRGCAEVGMLSRTLRLPAGDLRGGAPRPGRPISTPRTRSTASWSSSRSPSRSTRSGCST